jgi:hypothetical protein
MIVEKYKTWVNFFVMGVCSWICYIGFIVIVHYGVTFNSVAIMATVFFSGKFYLNFFLIIITCAMIDLTTYSYDTLFANNLAGTLMVLVKERGSLNDKVDLPPIVSRALKKYDIYKQDEREEDDNNKNRYSDGRDNMIEVSETVKDIGPINKENEPGNSDFKKYRANTFVSSSNEKHSNEIRAENIQVSSSLRENKKSML